MTFSTSRTPLFLLISCIAALSSQSLFSEMPPEAYAQRNDSPDLEVSSLDHLSDVAQDEAPNADDAELPSRISIEMTALESKKKSQKSISKHPITVAQYCAFLNAVAASDPHHLYHPNMGDNSIEAPLIIRSGSPGNYIYSIGEGSDDLPITDVTYFDAARFCNWLENGQPWDTEEMESTETGAYTFQEEEIVDINSHASWLIPAKKEYETLSQKLSNSGEPEEPLIYWSSHLEKTGDYRLWEPPLINGSASQNSSQTLSLDPHSSCHDLGFYLTKFSPMKLQGFIASPQSLTASHLQKTQTLLTTVTKYVAPHILPEVLEQGLYAVMAASGLGLTFLALYVLFMLSQVLLAWKNRDDVLAKSLIAHMSWDVSCILLWEVAGCNVPESIYQGLSYCNLGWVTYPFSMLHEFLHQSGECILSSGRNTGLWILNHTGTHDAFFSCGEAIQRWAGSITSSD